MEGWLQATRQGSIRVLLRKGSAAAAATLAVADVAEGRIDGLDRVSRARARSLAAMATLEHRGQDSRDEAAFAARRASAIATLADVAAELDQCLGAGHADARGAHANVAVASRSAATAGGACATEASAKNAPLPWAHFWQPALGAALSLDVR